VSGHVFAARSQSLVYPEMGCEMCLNLSDIVLRVILIRHLGVFSADSWIFCRSLVCAKATVNDQVSFAWRMLGVTGMVSVNYGFAVVMDWMSGLHLASYLWRYCTVTHLGGSASAFWECRQQ
jgi:hypothetical protein